VSHALAIGMLPRTNHRAFAEYSLESLTLATTGCDRAAILDRQIQWMCADTPSDVQTFAEQWDTLIVDTVTQDTYDITPASDWFVVSGEEDVVEFYGRLYTFEGKNLLVRYQPGENSNRLSLGVGNPLSQLPEMAVPLTFESNDTSPPVEEDTIGNLERLGGNLLRNVRTEVTEEVTEAAEEVIADELSNAVEEVLADERVSAVVDNVEAQLSDTPLSTAIASNEVDEATLNPETTATTNDTEGGGLLGNITNTVGNAVRRNETAAPAASSTSEATSTETPKAISSDEGGSRFGLGRIPNPFARDANGDGEATEQGRQSVSTPRLSRPSLPSFRIPSLFSWEWLGLSELWEGVLGIVRMFFAGLFALIVFSTALAYYFYIKGWLNSDSKEDKAEQRIDRGHGRASFAGFIDFLAYVAPSGGSSRFDGDGSFFDDDSDGGGFFGGGDSGSDDSGGGFFGGSDFF
jgi:hypothetical protein